MLRYTLFVFGLLASNAAAVDRFSSVTTRSRAFSGRSGAAPKVVQQSARAGNLQKVRGGSTPAPTKPKAPSPAYIAYVLAWTTAPTAIRFILASMRGLPFHNPEQWQLAISACWAVNNIAVVVPGRYDGKSAEGTITQETANLFSPAGWAFAIWGPIFLGEWLMMLALTNLNTEAFSSAGKIVAPGWCAGTLAQVLWCATFRPSLGAATLWIPTVMLGVTSVFLGFAHNALRAQGGLSIPVNFLVRWPLALHFGWITAATLVNFNKWLSLRGSSVGIKSLAAKGSDLAALVVTFYVSYSTRDPIFAGVIAWALAAVGADGSCAARGAVEDATLDFNSKVAKYSSFVAAGLCLVLIGPGAFK